MREVERLVPVYIGLGANMGDSRATLAEAVQAIDDIPGTRVVLRSSVYRSAPMGPQDQPDYFNSVVAALTRCEPRKFLDSLLAIERQHGRVRNGQRWGPRTLDLDLLVFGSQTIAEEGLCVPHPGLAQRNFVLYPLAEIAPRLFIPGQGIAEDLARAAGPSGLAKLE